MSISCISPGYDDYSLHVKCSFPQSPFFFFFVRLPLPVYPVDLLDISLFFLFIPFAVLFSLVFPRLHVESAHQRIMLPPH